MQWIVGVFLILGLLALIVFSKEFRKAAIIAVALITALVIAWIQYEDAQISKRKNLLKPAELEVSGFNIKSGYGGSLQFSGRVKNLSALYNASSFGIEITAFDCPETKITDKCDLIGKEEVKVFVKIPLGQVREFGGPVHFPNMPKAKNHLWEHKIVWAEGGKK